jgi:hypothetical protein
MEAIYYRILVNTFSLDPNKLFLKLLIYNVNYDKITNIEVRLPEMN